MKGEVDLERGMKTILSTQHPSYSFLLVHRTTNVENWTQNGKTTKHFTRQANDSASLTSYHWRFSCNKRECRCHQSGDYLENLVNSFIDAVLRWGCKQFPSQSSESWLAVITSLRWILYANKYIRKENQSTLRNCFPLTASVINRLVPTM